MNQSASHFFSKAWLYCTVFLTGAAVMVIELLGTRLIAPFYGASLYVWTSLIAVTLIALALGYYIGGIWADRARSGLSLIIALAGLLTLIIPWLTGPILLATDPLGLRLGSFISTLILFSPSLMMLGMVGPFAVKLSTSALANVGASTGSIYAISTVGSVIGTLFLGFYLFPLVGSREIFIGLGIALFLLALIVVVIERKYQKTTVTTLPTAALVVFGLGLYPQIANSGMAISNEDFITQFERESLYGWVRVIDKPKENIRLLTVDASTIGAASISHGENLLTYQKIVTHIPALTPAMSKALLIGQGAGHMAMTLKEYGIVTDTLEIDPAVAEAATQFFGFKPNGKTIIGDARYEIRQLKGPYDLIILDVFTGGAEPTHLLTVETLTQLSALLAQQGILALNFVSFYENGSNPALASVAKTIGEVFPYQQAFISDPGADFNDFIFLATQHAINLENQDIADKHSNWLKQRQITIDQSHGVILTDNLSRLELLQMRKSEYYRRMIVDSIGSNHFIR
ncbi:MAG: SAM-dependent methyltransferase [Nitrosomonas sp. PRO4]|nr:SAM-dependent methyltransferase [Nitrosomonas sp. PRO4]